MRWRGRRASQNVEYRGAATGGPRMLKMGGGIGTLVLLLVAVYFGIDPGPIVNGPLNNPGGIPGGGAAPEAPLSPEQEDLREFVAVVLADTEDVWTEQFREMGREYTPALMVVFSERVQSACGFASSASGPFYCPADQQVYIDLAFYEELDRRFGAPGDFAQAYVLAHEVGHHVQNLMGISRKVQSMQGRVSEEEYNDLSVRLELQADFLAGVWAHHADKTKNILEPGDVEEALAAASAIGDDTLQKRSQGYVVPESFTHGTSQQRVRWFRRGLETGDFSQGDTFSARDL